LTDTVDNGCAKKLSKKQQRDAHRVQEHRATKASPATARWKLLAKRQLWAARKDTCNAVWTAWMAQKLDVRRKLRGLLWREWTRPQIGRPPQRPLPPGCTTLPMGLQVLGSRSLRDDYILARARAFTNHPSIRSLRASGLSKAISASGPGWAFGGRWILTAPTRRRGVARWLG